MFIARLLLSVFVVVTSSSSTDWFAAAQPTYQIVSTTKGGPSANPTANVTYSCTITNLWTAARHPVDYPTKPQLSVPLIVAHSVRYRVWVPGSKVNTAFRTYIETGVPDRLLFALASTTQVLDERLGKVQNVLTTTQQTIPRIRVTQRRSYLTTVTPFDPSPDWFSGFYAFNTIDKATNRFLKSFTILVYPFNGGTRSGDTYTSPGTELTNFSPVARISNPPNGVFLNPQRNFILPVASWTCRL